MGSNWVQYGPPAFSGVRLDHIGIA